VRDRFTDQARRVLEVARAEADRLGQRYLGPEHVVLGMLDDGTSAAAQALRAQGLELDEGRAELARLADRGEVARPRPSDAELLEALGIDLNAVRQRTEQAFGGPALGRATREATRARRRGIARVPRTPLEGPPLLIGRTLQFAGERADALGHATVGPELLLLGVLDDITKPWPRCMSNRWRRRLLAHLGLPSSYRGAARPLLEAFGVNLEDLRGVLGAHLQGARP
jgi:ATP-dependent Clp protease ATP-binding subunit ClpA